MQAIKSTNTRSLNIGTELATCDNSGAKIVRITAVSSHKTVKKRIPAAGIGDIVMGSVKKGTPEMRKTVVHAIIVRQKKEYKRRDGTRIKFEDNALVVLKDDKGNPKGTSFKGPIAKEACERWPGIAKIASVIV
jgi:large subunit ribosomal protein L14